MVACPAFFLAGLAAAASAAGCTALSAFAAFAFSSLTRSIPARHKQRQAMPTAGENAGLVCRVRKVLAMPDVAAAGAAFVVAPVRATIGAALVFAPGRPAA